MTAGDCEPLWLDAALSGPVTAWMESPATSPAGQPERRPAPVLAAAAAAGELTPVQADRILQRIVAVLSAECVTLRREKQARDRMVGELLGAGLALHEALTAVTHPYEDPPGDSVGCQRLVDPGKPDGLVCAELPDAAEHQTPDVVLGREEP